MRYLFSVRRLAGLFAATLLLPSAAALSQTASIESAVLRLDVNAAPYSYTLKEKSTGTVLVSQALTTLTAGSARDVTGASISAQTPTTLDATLTLSGTADTARVQFSFVTPGIVKVVLSANSGTPTNVKEQFLDQGEHVYGVFGLASTTTGANLDIRGANRDLLGVGNMPGSNWANSRAPFYVTDRKYGIWTDSEARGHYTVAVGGRTSFDFNAPTLTYYVIYGPSYREIMYGYNFLAGGSFMPPLYAFSPFWWRDDHTQDFGPNGVTSMQGLVLKDADKLQELQMPASAMWIDRPVGSQQGGGLVGWGNFDLNPAANGFPDPVGMIRNLNDRGMKLLVWIANRANNSMLTDPLLAPYRFTTGCRVANCTTTPAIDIRDPVPYAQFQNRLDSYAALGVAGYKIDRGEEAELPDSLMNEFTVLVHKMSYEQLFRNYGKEAYQFARNNYDRSRKYAATWNGDTEVNFNGLIQSVKMATRTGAINFPMYGSDTGGYSGAPNKEVFARWLAFSAHTSIMEILLGPNRTIWNNYQTGANANPPALIDVARKWSQEHHDMIPYVRSIVYMATQTGWPVHQMMPIAFPNDTSPGFHDMWNQYMFGDALLIAPVTTAGATSRSVYLPAGSWYDYNDKLTRIDGPTTLNAAAPLDAMPRYVKAGAIVPRGDIYKANNNWTPNWAPYLRIEYFPAQGVVSAFDYYNGTTLIPIRGTRNGNIVTLKFNNPGTDGKVEMYAIGGVSSVMRNGQALIAGTDYQYDAATRRLTIPYTGATALVVTVSG